jgi:hypothetical protein
MGMFVAKPRRSSNCWMPAPQQSPPPPPLSPAHTLLFGDMFFVLLLKICNSWPVFELPEFPCHTLFVSRPLSPRPNE